MKYLLSLLVSIALLTIAGLSCFHYAISNVAYTPGAFSMFENTNAASSGYVHVPWNERKFRLLLSSLYSIMLKILQKRI